MANNTTEILDLDFDKSYSASSKNHEKDLIIESLNKQLRFQRYESEKKAKEFEAAIIDLKGKIFDYEKQLNESHLIKTIKSLEETLTETEKEVCELKEKDIENKKEIFQLETRIFQIKQQNQTFSKSFRKNLVKPAPANTTACIKPIPSDEKMEEIENNEKLLQEKDKEILALKEKMNELEIYYQTQLNSCMEKIKQMQTQGHNKFSIIGSEADGLRLQIMALQDEIKREKLIANEQICELMNENKLLTAKYEESLLKLEHEFNEKMSNNLKQQLDRSQTKEVTLLDELKKQDEDLDSLRKLNKELEKKVEFLRRQKENLEAETQRKLEALEKRDLKAEMKKIESKYEKILNESKEKLETQLHAKNQLIQELDLTKEANLKRILHLEGENRKFCEMNTRLQEKLRLMEKAQSELEEKTAEIIKTYENKLQEIESNYEFEKQTNAYFRNINRGNAMLGPGKRLSFVNSDLQIINKPEFPENESMSPRKNTLSFELKTMEANFLFPGGQRHSFTMNPSMNNSVINAANQGEESPSKDSMKDCVVSLRDTYSRFGNKTSKFKTQSNLAETFSELNEENVQNIEKNEEKLPDEQKSLVINEEDLAFDREMQKRSEEVESLRREMKSKDEEIDSLRSENKSLKENLQKIEEKWLQELEVKKKKERENLLTEQRSRQRSIDLLVKGKNQRDLDQSKDINTNNEEFKRVLKEKKELEGEIFRLKRELKEESEFLKEELRKMEEKSKEDDKKMVNVLNERDYFEVQWRELLEEMKLAKMNTEKDKKNNKEKKISKWLLCTCK